MSGEGVSIGLATHSPPLWCTLLHPPPLPLNSFTGQIHKLHRTSFIGKFINYIEIVFLANSRCKSGGRVHEAILPGQNLKGNLSDQILWTNSATRCISQHASTHPIHSPGKFTPDHPWTSLETRIVAKL